jgi:hypothetical protein
LPAISCFQIKPAETGSGSDPHNPRGTFGQSNDFIIRYARGILTVCSEDKDGMTIIDIQTGLGAYPDKTAGIYKYALSRALTESLFKIDMFERYILEPMNRTMTEYQEAETGKKRYHTVERATGYLGNLRFHDLRPSARIPVVTLHERIR